jgi:hypothetical protein
MAWIRTIDLAEAQRDPTGRLAVTYARMKARPMPKPYIPPHGGAPGIILAHSLDADLIDVTFGGMSASLAAGDALTWPQRELVNAVTSRANQCFY